MPVTWPSPGAMNTSMATTSANTQVLIEKYASRRRNRKSGLTAPIRPQTMGASGNTKYGETDNVLAAKIVV